MFNEKLRHLRKEKGLTLEELAWQYNNTFSAGLNKGTLSKYENGRQEPMVGVVKNLAQLFDVTVDYLIDDSGEKGALSVPVYSNLGFKNEGKEIIGYEEISAAMAAGGDYFGLVITDDRMEPRMFPGDTIIVRKQSAAESGSIVVVTIGGRDKPLVNKFIRQSAGMMLIPLNTSHEPLYFTHKEVDAIPVTIKGRVVELRSRL